MNCHAMPDSFAGLLNPRPFGKNAMIFVAYCNWDVTPALTLGVLS